MSTLPSSSDRSGSVSHGSDVGGGALVNDPSSVKEEVLTKHRYTIMSHPLTLKAALVLKQGLTSAVQDDPTSAFFIARMLCRSQDNSDDACGPLRFKPAEETFTSVDMVCIQQLLPLYCQTVASTLSISSQYSARNYVDLVTSVPVPHPQNGAVWSFDQPPFSQNFSKHHHLFCCHQMTTGDMNQCFMDGLIALVHPTVLDRMYPLCLLECVVGKNIDTKIGQSSSYFNKLYAQQSTDATGNHFPILSIRYNSEMIAFDVCFKPPAVDEDPEAVGRIPLHKTQIPFNAQSIHAMMKLVAFWVQTFSSMYNPATQRWDIGRIAFKKDQTCLEVDGRMFKLFSNDDGASRKPGRFFSYVPHTSCIHGQTSKDEYFILSYPKISGSHWPSHLKHIFALIQSVCNLLYHVHGDIRLFNIVFHNQDDGVSIIDWDLSRSEGELYPACYNHDIGLDGTRHPGARAGQPLDHVHDVYAVLALLHQFQLQDPEANVKYHALLPTLHAVTDDQLVSLLPQLLRLMQSSFGNDDGTGIGVRELPLMESPLPQHNSGTGSLRRQALRLGNAAQDAAVEVVSQQPAAEDQVAPRLQNVSVPVAREFALLPGSHVGAPIPVSPWDTAQFGQSMVPAAPSSVPVVAASFQRFPLGSLPVGQSMVPAAASSVPVVAASFQRFPLGSLPVGQSMVPSAASSAPVVAALQGGVGGHGVVEPPAAAPPNLTGRKRSRSEDQ